ncbi:phosphate transport regulator-like protein [Mariprofundus ferrooxydans PV-1]|uniref:Phosphate transport regulator-like protein n=2 Tax=Mariprofundus ferrooxydans TaxID=314344 RepID=Q0EZH2_9PROT|nr:phosphate transport regulator-like protein [Mariprofundus ferrooxydans PV-1]
MPDFFSLINEQCDLCVQTMTVFVSHMERGDADTAAEIRHLEKQGDKLKRRNNHVLDKAFTTPMDREDIYDAITSIDEIINYAKSTIRELEVLSLEPDRHMLEMAIELRAGSEALQRGFAKLSTNPAHAEHDAMAARKAERKVENVYRHSIAELFQTEAMLQKIPGDNNGDGHQLLALAIIDIFKHREIYRHMSNGADRLAHAADKLNDIIVKIS